MAPLISVETDIDLEDYYDDIPDDDLKEIYKDRFGISTFNQLPDNDTFNKLIELYNNSPLWFNDVMDNVEKLDIFKNYTT